MPPKKKKLTEAEIKEKEKQRLEEERLRRQDEQDKLAAKLKRENKEHSMRKAMLDGSLKHFESVKKRMKSERKKERELKLWNKYLDPKATPNMISPPEIRRYLYKWELDDTKEKESSCDLRLLLNERSILTQDRDVRDRRMKVFQDCREPIGEKYYHRIDHVLKMIKEMSEELKYEEQFPEVLFQELAQLHLLVKKALVDFIDKWSFSVLSDIDRDMIFIDPITAHYSYNSDLIKHYLWTFREVPLSPDYNLVNYIPIEVIQSEFTKSNLMDFAAVSFRSMWLTYDHFSELAPSFKLNVEIKKLYDLRTELHNEKILALKLRDEKLNRMKEERKLYEEHKIQLAAQAAELNADKVKTPEKQKKEKKKPKKELLEFEPPIIEENTLIDIEQELSTHLKQEFVDAKGQFSPVHLNLTENEVNLRENTIIGGLFVFHILQRPKQTKVLSEHFLLTLIDQPDILRYKDFYYEYKESPRPRQSVLMVKETRRQSIFPKQPDVHELIPTEVGGPSRPSMYIQERRNTVAQEQLEEEERRWVTENEMNQKSLYEIKIKLRDDVFWWEIPSVCRWEPWEKSEEFKKLSPAMQNYNINYETIIEENRKKLFSAPPVKRDFKTIKQFNDASLAEIAKDFTSHQLITQYLLPRMPDDYKFYSEKIDEAKRKEEETVRRNQERREAREREKLRQAELAEAKVQEELAKKRAEEELMAIKIKNQLNSVQVGTQTEQLAIEKDSKRTSTGSAKRSSTGSTKRTSKDTPSKRRSTTISLQSHTKNTEKLVASSKEFKSPLQTDTDESNSANQLVQTTVQTDQPPLTDLDEPIHGDTQSELINKRDVSIQVSETLLTTKRTSKSSTGQRRSLNSSKRTSGSLSIKDAKRASSIVSLKKNISSTTSLKQKKKPESSKESVRFDVTNVNDSNNSTAVIHARSSFKASFLQVKPENSGPRLLFPIQKRKKPMVIVEKEAKDGESLFSIKLNELLAAPSEGFDEDGAKLSEFVAHLEDLSDKESPFFHSDSYIDRIMKEIDARRRELEAEEEAKKLKEIERLTRLSKMLEVRKRKSTFYRVPRRTLTEITRSSIWEKDIRGRKGKKLKRGRKSSASSGISIKANGSIIKKTTESKVSYSESINTFEEPLELVPHKQGKWTTKDIHYVKYDVNSKTITFKAGIFGTFGLYISKYVNFPFNNWSITPKQVDEEIIIVFTLEIKYTTLEFQVSSKGFKVGAFLKTKSFLTELVPIVKEYKSFNELKEKLQQINLNVFPEQDISHYNSTCSEKFEPLELHTFKSMSSYCLTHQFMHCHWNRYADYRSILLKSRPIIENKLDLQDSREILVTPMKSEFVHTNQKCTEDLACVELSFMPNPPHQNFNADLFNLLSEELVLPSRKKFESTDTMLQWNLYNLLSNIKIFSYTQ